MCGIQLCAHSAMTNLRNGMIIVGDKKTNIIELWKLDCVIRYYSIGIAYVYRCSNTTDIDYHGEELDKNQSIFG